MLKIDRKDTIVAPATAPGMAAISVIRLSGSGSLAIADTLFASVKSTPLLPSDMTSHTLQFGHIVEDNRILDEVLLSVFKNPHSYTGEDVVEISCHGSTFIQQKIIQLCQKLGARLAEPGEFTLRAFLNRKFDLSQAEAVADLIASDSALSHELAMKQMRGGFSNEIKKLRAELINFASLIELELDFAEEDVEFANRKELMHTVGKIQHVIRQLIDSFELGNVIRHGIPVVIAGKPNVGKSTLLNVLLNEERAIVSEIAGTTRDTVEEEIVIRGIKFRFIDTAGIRETQDLVERIGVNKTFEKIRQSPLLIYLFDVNETSSADLQKEMAALHADSTAGFKIIPVANKIDGKDQLTIQNVFRSIENIHFISAKENMHIERLRETLAGLIETGRLQTGNVVVANSRHAEALRRTNSSLEQVMTGLEKGISNDFIANDLRIALHYLGEITGEISTEDLLENIFSRFCIGK